jgi:surface protein
MINLKEYINEGLFNDDNIDKMSRKLNNYIELELFSDSNFNYQVLGQFYPYAKNIVDNLNINGKFYENIPASFHLKGNKKHKARIYCNKNLEDLRYLINNNKELISVDFSNYVHPNNTINVNDAFIRCEQLKTVKFGKGLENVKIKNAARMFCLCKNLEEIDLYNLDFSECEDISQMFQHDFKLKTVNFGNAQFKNFNDFSSAFGYCESLENIDLTNFDFSKCKDISGLFMCCTKLKSLNLGQSKIRCKDFSNIFDRCKSLERLDLTNISFNKVKKVDYFYRFCAECSNLKELIMPQMKNEIYQNIIDSKWLDDCGNLEIIKTSDQKLDARILADLGK